MNIKKTILMIIIISFPASLVQSGPATSSTAPASVVGRNITLLDIALLDVVDKSIRNIPGFDNEAIKAALPNELYERFARLKNEKTAMQSAAQYLNPDYRDQAAQGQAKKLSPILEEDEEDNWGDQDEE